MANPLSITRQDVEFKSEGVLEQIQLNIIQQQCYHSVERYSRVK